MRFPGFSRRFSCALCTVLALAAGILVSRVARAGDDDAPDQAPVDQTPDAVPVDAPPARPGSTRVEPEPEATVFATNWFSLGVQVDTLVLPTGHDVCAGGTGYTCFGAGGYYPALPLAGADDGVNGGVRLATVRILAGYDRALGANFTIGGRVGYAFHGGPTRPGGTAFEPFHLEARASYWFGNAPLARPGLRPYVTAAAGVAEVDASIPADVYASPAAYEAGQSVELTAWKKTGEGFGALGFGTMVALTSTSGIVLEVKAQATFPTAGAGAAAQLAYAQGF